MSRITPMFYNTHVYACINYIFSAGDVYSSVLNYTCMHVRREGMCTALSIYTVQVYMNVGGLQGSSLCREQLAVAHAVTA